MRNQNLERKPRKKKVLSSNRSFVDVTPFENSMINDHEMLTESKNKKKHPKLSKMIYFNVKKPNIA